MTPVERQALPKLHYRPITDEERGTSTSVDVARLVESRMLLVANSGGGKSRAIRSLLEETSGHVQQIVFDLEGEFTTLPDVIVAGEEGDVPAHPDLARTLCKRLMSVGASAVLNLYDLKVSDRRRFVRLFLEELMSLPRSLWRPCLIVLDEAHVLCPERGSGEAESTEAVITLCTQGRKRGYCAVLATQRISKLHKDAAAELLNKLIGRTSLDVDVKRAASELGLERRQWPELAALHPGEFFAYGPAISQTVMRVQTADVVTRPPKDAPLAAMVRTESIHAMLAKLGDLPAIAKEDADNAEALKTRVSQLEKDLRDKARELAQCKGYAEAEVQSAIVHAVASSKNAATGAMREIIALAQRYVDLSTTTEFRVENTEPAGAPEVGNGTFDDVVSYVVPPSLERPITPFVYPHRPHSSSSVPTERAERLAPVSTKMTGTADHRVLLALHQLLAIGQTSPDRRTVAGWAGLSPKVSTFRNALTVLRRDALVYDGPKGQLALTERGRGHRFTSDEGIRSREQLHQLWLARLAATPQRILRVLLDSYPAVMHRETVATMANLDPAVSTFRNALTELRGPGLIESVGSTLRASDILFPLGMAEN